MTEDQATMIATALLMKTVYMGGVAWVLADRNGRPTLEVNSDALMGLELDLAHDPLWPQDREARYLEYLSGLDMPWDVVRLLHSLGGSATFEEVGGEGRSWQKEKKVTFFCF